MPAKNKLKNDVKPSGPSEKKANSVLLWGLAAAIAIITLVCFWPVRENGFMNWDDNAYIFENDHLSRPLSEAIVYFFQPHYYLGSYTPVTMVVYALEYHVAGMDAAFFHTVQLLLHILCTLLVLFFTYHLSGRRIWVAAIVALLFGIHPMHAESVIWAAELKDVLYGIFFVGGLIVYLKYLTAAEQPDKRRQYGLWATVFILFVLSLLSKPAAVTFPVVLLLVDFYTGRKYSRRLLIEKIPFFVLAVIIGIVTIKAQGADGLLMHHRYSVPQRLVFACYAFLCYLVKVVVPWKLSIFYPYPKLVNGHMPYILYAAPVAVAALVYLVYRTLRHGRVIAFGFLFFVVNMVLVLQVISEGVSIMADHYTYLSYIGLFFILAMGFDKLLQRDGQRFKLLKQVATATVVVFCCVSAYVSNARCAVWRDGFTMADDIVEKFPDDPVALNNKGFMLYFQGAHREAIPYFVKAIQQTPDYQFAFVNLANAYIALQDYGNAHHIADSALKILPGNFDILNSKGYIFLLERNYSEAIRVYTESMKAKPVNRNAYLGTAESYYQLKDYVSEIKVLDRGLKHLPGDHMLLNYKGYALATMGKYKEAIPCFEAALASKPGFEPAEQNLQNCYKAMQSSK
ncbi:MAG: transrane and repeat-containing protein [Flavipsychrobacter sp.]|jgi:tetratricopeptide (TPR) repeat protein|nr:transrane and repeat-containing protein [Flavipsychrobacter sp.]